MEGDNVEQGLWLVKWERGEILDLMKANLGQKIAAGEFTDERAAKVQEGPHVALDGCTYLKK